MSGPLLDVTVLVSTPNGPLSLNEPPYELAGDTFNTISVTHRRQEATNPFIEGTYTVNSVRENIVHTLSVYVRGTTHQAFEDALKALCAAFDQSTFEIRRIVQGSQEDWQCFASDYTVGLQREFLHARMAKVDFQVIAHPGARILSNQSSAL